MTEYKCDKCGKFCADQGYFEIEYFDTTIRLVGASVYLKSHLCAECAKEAIIVMKKYISSEREMK